MLKIFKVLFYIYVIGLAGYVSYKNVMHKTFAPPQVQFVKPQKECVDKGDWSYCVFRTPRSFKDRYLYVFHDKDEGAEFWELNSSYPALLQAYWQSQSLMPPTVISISFGSAWVATEKMSKESTGLLARFKSEVFKTVEKEQGKPRRRYLLGSSLGGLNALTIGFHFRKQFSKVVALCPPVYTLSPFASWKQVARFVARTGSQGQALLTAVGMGRKLFANNAEWLKFSHLEKVKTLSFSKDQAFYLTAGMRDQFGAYEGVQMLAGAIEQRGGRIEWHPSSGDHCAIDIKSVSDFILK